jgi:CAAX prenyl protease-like protein
VLDRILQSPALVRVVSFALFLALTFLQDRFGDTARFWIYFAKTLAGAGMLLAVRSYISELRWKFSWGAIVVGVGVFVIWVGLDELLIRIGFARSYPKLNASGTPWNPNVTFVSASALATFFVIVRILGSSLVVPPIEEIFYRSFVYRYIVNTDFQNVPFRKFHLLSFLFTSVVFGLEHREWLAGILCGFAYQALVICKDRLGDAITAHAITNFLLGLWVVWRGAWEFW